MAHHDIPVTSGTVPLGTRIELCGLGREELNGRSGAVVSLPSGSQLRYGIKVEGCDKAFAVRGCNFRVAAAEIDQLASALTRARVAAPSNALGALAVCALEVRDRLLMDEAIVGRILELVQTPSSETTYPIILDAIKRSHAALLSACSVCRTWLAAGAKPMLVVLLQQQLLRATLCSDFCGQQRAQNEADLKVVDNDVYKGVAATAWARLGERDRDIVRWLVSGYENGFNSVIASEPGHEGAEAVALQALHYYRSQGCTGPFLVLSPIARWRMWLRELPALGMRVIECQYSATDPRSIQDRIENAIHDRECHGNFVVMVPSDEPTNLVSEDSIRRLSEGDDYDSEDHPNGVAALQEFWELASNYENGETALMSDLSRRSPGALEDYLTSGIFKWAIIDGRRATKRPSTASQKMKFLVDNLAASLMGRADDVIGCATTIWLTEEQPPSTIPEVIRTAGMSGMLSIHALTETLEDPHGVLALLERFAKRSPECTAYTMRTFLMPKLRAILHSVYRRRAHIEAFETILAVQDEDRPWASTHPLMGKRVMLVDLPPTNSYKCQPPLKNLSGFNGSTGRVVGEQPGRLIDTPFNRGTLAGRMIGPILYDARRLVVELDIEDAYRLNLFTRQEYTAAIELAKSEADGQARKLHERKATLLARFLIEPRFLEVLAGEAGILR